MYKRKEKKGRGMMKESEERDEGARGEERKEKDRKSMRKRRETNPPLIDVGLGIVDIGIGGIGIKVSAVLFATLLVGFVCENSKQSGGYCSDFKVRFMCPVEFCYSDGTHQEQYPGCWTGWFDRDNPSGTGDWETLVYLRKENPGKICDKPLAIEALTTAGASVSSTGDVISSYDIVTGFVCENKKQVGKRLCRDYKVRFLCPVEFCYPGGCWTDWFNRDRPSGTGDWELLANIKQQFVGKVCDVPLQIEVQTAAGASVASTGNIIASVSPLNGFVCVNTDQPHGKKCVDYRVRFYCPALFCKGQRSHQEQYPGCWTGWFDRDNPSGTGDWETLVYLRKENPGKICDKPLAIEALTTAGASVSSTGDVISSYDTVSGFVCENKKQSGGYCSDYKVRFLCPVEFCYPDGCWTDWFNRDRPSGTGDWELLANIKQQFVGKVCDVPLQIEVQTAAGASVASTGNIIASVSPLTGFVCLNADQPKGKVCVDYRVRFYCPALFCKGSHQEQYPGCWTSWFDRDNPSGTGDWETLVYLRKENPGKICGKPLAIEALTTAGASVSSTGDVISSYDIFTGFVCENKKQVRKRQCRDYKVRFLCPVEFCYPRGCWTQWFNRDRPSGTGDWELLANIKQQFVGKVCDVPLQIEVQTAAGASVASTGNIIASVSPLTGFVCLNTDQGQCKMCADYRVRFYCPPRFCKGGGVKREKKDRERKTERKREKRARENERGREKRECEKEKGEK
ncbi:hypothetical protein WMY93_028913 [Mugilogobius chulae]|uniref:WxxW domain-containing protein n=1 Tax=Mugilogobius chulae TaxID=88201 RepID=A0AAW0MYS3_9GOBI